MSENSFLYHVLKDKLPISSEIELHLFDFCNLRCTFCGQDHESKEGMEEIRNKILPVQEFISKNTIDSHIVNIMGGEIFNDEVPDHLFKDYENLATSIHEHAQSLGHQCTFNWVTNLVFKKSHRVENLLTALKSKGISTNLSTSYDFSGRKTSLWKEDLFKENLEKFKTNIYTVGFVMTKPTIQFLLNQNDPYFEYLYGQFPIYFDFYVPEKTARFLMPSDQDMLDAYLFLAKRYPKVSPVKELLTRRENRMTCYSLNKLTLLPSGKEVKCRYLKYETHEFNNPIDYSSNENIVTAHLEENGCLSCEWFERCSFRCFVQADWSTRVKTPDCFFKTFFAEVIGVKNEVQTWN